MIYFVRSIGFALINLTCLISNAQIEKVISNLLLEDPVAATYYLKSVKVSDEKKLFELEIALLQNDLTRFDSLYKQINKSALSTCSEIQYLTLAGLYFHEVGDFTVANNQFLRASEQIKKCDPYYEANLNYWAGYSKLEQLDLMGSELRLRKALHYFQKDSVSNYIKIGRIFFWLGTVKLTQNQLDSATYWLTRSLHLHENTPLDKTSMLIKLYNNLGNVKAREWEYKESIEFYEKAIRLNKSKLMDKNELAIACANLGRFYADFENMTEANTWYRESLHWLEQGNLEPNKKALIIQNYATALTSSQEFSKARILYQQAARILEPYLDTYSQLNTKIQLNIINSYLFEEKLDDAERVSQPLNAIMHDKKESWPEEYADWLLFKANTLKFRDRFEEALEILKVLEINCRDRNDVARLQDIEIQIGDCQHRLNRFVESRNTYRKILSQYREVYPETHPKIIYLYNNLGATFVGESNYDSALFYFKYAKLKNILPNPLGSTLYVSKIEWIVSNYHLLLIDMKRFLDGKCTLSEFKLNEGIVYSTLSVFESKRIELQEELDAINLGRLTRDFYDEALNYYFELFRHTQDPAYIEKAFFISEKTKYQALHHAIKLDRVSAFSGVTEKVMTEEQNTIKRVSQLEFQYSQELSKQQEPLPDLINEYLRNWTVTQNRMNSLIDSIKLNLPDYYNLKFNKSIVSINQIRESFLSKQKDMAWVSYYLGKTTSYAIVITPSSQFFFTLGNTAQLVRTLNAHTNYLELQHENRTNAALALYKLVYQSVDSVLKINPQKINKVVIIPDGVLNYLNFELLAIPQGTTWRYTVFDYHFSYGYSSTLLWMEFSEQTTWINSSTSMLGFAPAFTSDTKSNNSVAREGSEYETFDFSPLQKNQDEVIKISTLLKERKLKTAVYLGKDADESTFKKVNIQNFGIIHLATHGFVNHGRANLAGVAFARNPSSEEDGILYMDEIFSLHNRANLICLSACETGRGILQTGEGLIGLTRAFIYSGAQNLVVSLWKVEDESTANLMVDFYSNLIKKRSVSESLRQAKLTMIKKNPTINPYYWSAFIHIGLN